VDTLAGNTAASVLTDYKKKQKYSQGHILTFIEIMFFSFVHY